MFAITSCHCCISTLPLGMCRDCLDTKSVSKFQKWISVKCLSKHVDSPVFQMFIEHFDSPIGENIFQKIKSTTNVFSLSHSKSVFAQVVATVSSIWSFGVSPTVSFGSNKKCNVLWTAEQNFDKDTHSDLAIDKESRTHFRESHLNKPSIQNSTQLDLNFPSVLSAAISKSEKNSSLKLLWESSVAILWSRVLLK